MRKLITLLCLCVYVIARGQNWSYRYWFDANAEQQHTGTFTGNILQMDVSTDGLSDWFHTLHIQLTDTAGNLSPVLTRTFAIIPQETAGSRDLTGQPYRYWFDDADSVMQTGTLNSNVLELEALTEQLPSGVHHFHLQVCDDKGNWSPVLSRKFLGGNEPGVILPWGADWPWKSKYMFTDNRDNYVEPATDANGKEWTELDYDDSIWQTLTGPMSNTTDRWEEVGYIWEGDNNCFNLRRTFTMDSIPEGNYQLLMHHDDGVRVYLNGQKVVEDGGAGTFTYDIPREAFVVGKNMLAIYAEEGNGDQYLDYCLRYEEPENIAYTDLQGITYLIMTRDKTASATGYSNNGQTSLAIPETVNGNYRVASIADNAFANMDRLLTIELPASITAVGNDVFTGCGALAAVDWKPAWAVPNGMFGDVNNPNLLLYVDAAEYAPATFGGNVVVDGHAGRITLTEGYNFYAPRAFAADEVSYAHTYTMQSGLGEARGWETITLPFDVQSITHESAGALTPFALYQDAEDEHPFWLGELTGTGWQQSGRIEANRPYIICMPNNEAYDEAYNVAGRVTFGAKDVTIPKTEAIVGQGNGMTFTPVLQHVAVADSIFAVNLGEAYESHPEGSVFVRGLRAVQPFEGYITVPNAGAKVRYIPIGEDAVTGMYNLPFSMYDLPCEEAYFDLSGRRISKPTKAGVYLLKQGKTVQKVQVK